MKFQVHWGFLSFYHILLTYQSVKKLEVEPLMQSKLVFNNAISLYFFFFFLIINFYFLILPIIAILITANI